MRKKADILNTVRNYIDEYLNPRKCNIYDPQKENYVASKSINEILSDLDLSYVEYKEALSISSSMDFEIHYKRSPDSCFVNNYFAEGILSWKANLDIQPILSSFGVVNYLCAYLSKHEDAISQSMSEAAKTAKELNYSKFEQMKLIARAYTTKRECSVQECVYLILPELWLRKTFPKVEFANTNVLSKRVKMCLSKEKLEELDSSSCDIYQKNNADRYTERPCKPEALVKMCLAMFLSLYEKDYKLSKEDNDSQPIELDEKSLNVNHSLELSQLPKNITLLSSEKMKLRKVKKVLRFYQPNKLKDPEGYAHHLLMLYLPYRNEEDLMTNNRPFSS